MARSPFGWSYPPGAASDPNAPYNQPDPVSCLQEGVWTLCAAQGFDDEQCNRVMAIISAIEIENDLKDEL